MRKNGLILEGLHQMHNRPLIAEGKKEIFYGDGDDYVELEVGKKYTVKKKFTALDDARDSFEDDEIDILKKDGFLKGRKVVIPAGTKMTFEYKVNGYPCMSLANGLEFDIYFDGADDLAGLFGVKVLYES